MGLSVAQLEFLRITSSVHDTALEAQNIMSHKLALATQKDALYKEYNDALDATTIKVAYRNDLISTSYVDANYNTLCNYNENRIKQYALRDNKTDLLIVSEDIKRNYDAYGNDKFQFAHSMVNFDPEITWTAEDGTGRDNFTNEFSYYLNLWEAIKEAGGCQAIDSQVEGGEKGTEWFNSMVNAGLITIQVFENDNTVKEWDDTSVATSTNVNYLQEQNNDDKAKQAEAKYEFELDLINRIDQRYDTQLSKLETRKSTYEAQLESTKKIISESTEKFNLFS